MPRSRGSPAVVSVMWVNNEVGSLQPIAEIAARCVAAGVPLHSDGVQAFGKVPVDLRELPIALLTLSGHKIGAPKGIGALVVRDRALVESIIHGGGQQYGIRPGTENVAGAVALGCAARLAAAEQAAELPRLAALRDQLEAMLLRDVADLMVVGGERHACAAHPDRRDRRGPTAKPCSCTSTCRGSRPPAARPAPPVPWSRRTCSAPWAFRATWRWASSAFRSATRARRLMSSAWPR